MPAAQPAQVPARRPPDEGSVQGAPAAWNREAQWCVRSASFQQMSLATPTDCMHCHGSRGGSCRCRQPPPVGRCHPPWHPTAREQQRVLDDTCLRSGREGQKHEGQREARHGARGGLQGTGFERWSRWYSRIADREAESAAKARVRAAVMSARAAAMRCDKHSVPPVQYISSPTQSVIQSHRLLAVMICSTAAQFMVNPCQRDRRRWHMPPPLQRSAEHTALHCRATGCVPRRVYKAVAAKQQGVRLQWSIVVPRQCRRVSEHSCACPAHEQTGRAERGRKAAVGRAAAGKNE